MSNLVTSMVATGTIVYAGRVAQEKPIDVRIAIGAAAAAIGLTLMSNANEKLAQQFSWLILLGACFIYLPSVFRKTGILGGRK